MSNEELCDALIATFPTITLTGLTGDGAGITWDASGEVSKSPKGMVIENGLRGHGLIASPSVHKTRFREGCRHGSAALPPTAHRTNG